MKVKGTTIVFNSDEPHFTKEKLGHKPNTIRFIDSYPDLVDFEYIRIENKKSGARFTRVLTDISRVGILLGNEVFVFSWNPNEVIA